MSGPFMSKADMMEHQVAKLTKQREALREVCGKWADIIQGGDKLEKLEPWAQECVTEIRAAIALCKE